MHSIRVRRQHLVALFAGICALWLIAPTAATAAKGTDCAGADRAVTSSNIRASERTLLCLVNVYRTANGRALLTDDPALDRAARGHSNYMEATDQFAHDGIGNGTPTSRANAQGFSCSFVCVGENIAARGQGSSTRDMFIQWQNSPGHDANMLDPVYLTAGMGFALGPNRGMTGTQNFANVDGGATNTARDLLTSPACNAATAGLAKAKRAKAKAKKRVAKAKGRKSKRKAKRKLRAAKRKLRAANSKSKAACNLQY